MALDHAYPTPDPDETLESMAQWEAFFTGLGGAAGVISGVGNEFAPSINSGARTVTIASGAAHVRGFYSGASTSTTTAIPSAPVGSPRIDRKVLRLNRDAVTAAGWVNPVIIQGTPAANPQPPTIASGLTGNWDLPICQYRAAVDGSITGLVDERYKLGGSVVVFSSTARPPASPPRIGIELDTRRVLWSDGMAWNALSEDTGYTDLTLAGGGVTQGSITLAGRVINGVAWLKGSVNIGPIIVPADGLKVANIPAYLQPNKTIQCLVYQDGGGVLLALAYASGPRNKQLWLTGNLANANSNTVLHFDSQWPL